MAVPFLSSITLNKNEVQDFKVFNIGTGNPTLSSGGDIGYFWTDTSGSKVLKWWDGSAVRTVLDTSSSISGSQISGNITGGSGFVANALTAGSYLTSGGTFDGSVARTFAVDATDANTASKIVARDASGNFSAGTITASLSGNATTATTATTATNVAGGAAGELLYQSGLATTAKLGVGTDGYILTYDGTNTKPKWSASIPAGSVSGLAASATTDTTNAANITSGLLPLARLALDNGNLYVGDGSNKPVSTAKSSISLTGFGALTADLDIAGFNIINSGNVTSGSSGSTLATKGYVDSVAQGLDIKASCLVASTADINLSAPGSGLIDGIDPATFTSGTTRILVKDQSLSQQNGIYIWNGTGSAMTRSLDANTWDELVGAFTFIETGTANADSGWVCTADAGGTLGTTPVPFVKFSQAGSYTAGNGMVLSGGVFHFAQSSAYTAGRIPFASSTSAIGFSSNLFWDNANNRLGIGTTSTIDGKVHIYGDTYPNSQLRIQRNGAVNGTFSIGIAGSNNTLYIQDEVNATARLIIDGSGNLGLGVTPVNTANVRKLNIGGAVQSALTLTSNSSSSSARNWSIRSNVEAFGDLGFYQSTAQGFDPVDSGSLKMYLDASGRLGIGTATPAATVEVKTASSAGSAYISADSTGGSFRASGHVQFYTDNSAYDTIWFKANKGSQNMRLTDAGNLGLAATPMTWSGAGHMDFVNDGGVFSKGAYMNVGANWYYNAAFKYSVAGAATWYQQVAGAHNWFSAPAWNGSGSDALTFGDPKMVLDASGNLSNVGYHKAGLFTVSAGGLSAFDAASGGLYNYYSSGGVIAAYSDNSGTLASLTLDASSFVFRTAGTAKLTLNNSGVLLLKTNGTASAPTIANADDTNTGLYWPTDADTLALAVGGSDAIYIDSSRNVGIGTNPGYKLDIRDNSTGLLARLSSTSTGGCSMQFVSTSTNGRTYRIGSNYVSGAGEFSIYDDTAGAERLRIKSTGQLNLVGLNSAPAGAVGDLYYNSTSNTLQYHNNSAFQQISRKYSTALAGTNTSFTVTHNFGTRDVTVQVRKSGSTYDLVYTDVQMTTENAVTVIFATSVTGSDYTVTVIG